ncbi:MAG TPA: glycosyltransferase family A protein, partial [Acidimicrobiales bacterium]|nr:glycosyltransferase family A protein [Acidimicrobiales bacterium]
MEDEESPMISVVVPAYRASTLSECLAGILEQHTSEPFEVVVALSSDLGSEPPAIPSDPRLRVLSHVPRLGAAAARNRAVAASRGRLIAFTDADVMVSRDWLAGLSNASGGTYCVAGSVLNGTPRSAAGTVEYL